MTSREDETYIALFNEMNVDTDTNRILREIAISLGRIADMLAELNGYHIEYDEEKNTEMQIKTVKNASEAAEYEIPKQKDYPDVEFIEVKE